MARAGYPLPAVLAIYLLFGVFLGTVNPPITNSAVSGMPRSMAGLAGSLASAGRRHRASGPRATARRKVLGAG